MAKPSYGFSRVYVRRTWWVATVLESLLVIGWLLGRGDAGFAAAAFAACVGAQLGLLGIHRVTGSMDYKAAQAATPSIAEGDDR